MGFFTGLIWEKDEYLVFVGWQIQQDVPMVEGDLLEGEVKPVPQVEGRCQHSVSAVFFCNFSVSHIFTGLEITCLWKVFNFSIKHPIKDNLTLKAITEIPHVIK